jgi:hypothetical protein
MNNTGPDNDDDGTTSSSEATSESSAYEPEYEWEEIPIPGVFSLQNEYNDNLLKDNSDYNDDENDHVLLFSLHVLTVIPPPLEYMSQLHTQQQEISGRQVWTGSLFLAHVLFHHTTERQLLLQLSLLSCCQQQPMRYVLGYDDHSIFQSVNRRLFLPWERDYFLLFYNLCFLYLMRNLLLLIFLNF